MWAKLLESANDPFSGGVIGNPISTRCLDVGVFAWVFALLSISEQKTFEASTPFLRRVAASSGSLPDVSVLSYIQP